MRKVAILVFSVSALTVGAVPMAHAQSAAVPGTTETTQASTIPSGPGQGTQQSAPLFMIGRMPVQVWAPVESPYNANMNRTAADNPMWEAGAP